jgi:SAM-dependent methyltransferase
MAEVKYIHGTDDAEAARLRSFNKLVNPSFLDFLQLDGAKSVLEVGSGLGILTREVALRLPRSEVVGVEYSAEHLARADRSLPNLRFVQGDAHQLEFEDEYFDVVYCRWLLEHVADPQRALQEMRRVTKSGGLAFVEEVDLTWQRYDPPIPQFENVWARISVLQEKLGGDSQIGRRPLRLFKAAKLRDIMLSMGTEVHWSGTPEFREWVENELAFMRGCAENLQRFDLASRTDIEEALSALRELSERNDATTCWCWNRAKAIK